MIGRETKVGRGVGSSWTRINGIENCSHAGIITCRAHIPHAVARRAVDKWRYRRHRQAHAMNLWMVSGLWRALVVQTCYSPRDCARRGVLSITQGGDRVERSSVSFSITLTTRDEVVVSCPAGYFSLGSKVSDSCERRGPRGKPGCCSEPS